ncbi:MAG: very short patch repair endonuclease [Prolixibacteraceae bacterium]|jgi:DNA mismatch endonuclease (patch repair protein)|nr:very short patch repair endonuclease [Prolixibacteraceae bacterium]
MNNLSMAKYPEINIKVPRFNEANGFYTTKDRSELMRRIKSENTKPELKLRKFLWGIGIRYRKNVKKLPGTPDIVISRYKLIIFIDGEFWHGHNWEEKKSKIKSNRDFWIPKIERNMQRDVENNRYYSEKGWHVMRFWEHEIKKEFAVCISRIISYIEDCQLNNPQTTSW